MTKPTLELFHQERGVAFSEVMPGVSTPAYFSDPAAEHSATRRRCGLFDFSFMGCMEICGADARRFLQRLQTRNLARLTSGRIVYTLLLRADGSVLNDATLWQFGADRYRLFVGRRADLEHVAALAKSYSVHLSDRSAEQAVVAVQGIHAWAVLRRCFFGLPESLPYYAFATTRFGGTECVIARIGYSGEPGYELIVKAECGAMLWLALLEAGKGDAIIECGFAAADSLRIEAGHILFSRELATPVTPYELGFERLVDFYREPAVGMPVLRAHRWQEPKQRLVGLLIEREDTPLSAPAASEPPVEGSARMTSVCRSPVFGRVLALGFVKPSDRFPGTRVKLIGGGRARVARLPFYDPGRVLPRRMR